MVSGRNIGPAVSSGASVLAIALAIGSASPALAQNSTPGASSASANAAANASATADIIVTANRSGAQSLQTIPMAVSAVQASTLATKGINNISDIVKSVPSVNIIERGPGQSQVTIRGISSGAFSITETGDRPLVSVYLDDVPISIQGANPDIKVFDLERVEVLRGPQGTLYGSGSMAGTIRYITVKPSTTKFSGSVEGDLGTTSHAGDPNWNVRGSVNIPLGDTLAFLGSAYTGRDAGWIDNLGTGQKDANSARTTQARGALRWKGIDKLTVDASLLYTHLKTDGLPVGYSGLTRYQYNSLAPEGYRENLLVGNISTDLEVASGHLTTSSSYIDHHFVSVTGGFDYEYLNDFVFGGVRTASPAIVDQHVHTFTEEVRYVSKPDMPLTYSFGGFYEHTHRTYAQDNPLVGLDAAVGLPSIESFGTPFEDDLFSGRQQITERQFAFFGEANYKFLHNLDFTAGLRYFNFRQNFNLAFTGLAGSAFVPNPSGTPVFLPFTQTGHPKAKGVNPRFVLSYHAKKDMMIFAEASRGFRYGSVNEPVAPAFCNGENGPGTVGPDHLWNYALGLKSQTPDHALTFNLTGFYVDWRQVQTRVDLSCGYYYRINAGHVESKGLELETTLRPARGLSFTLNGSFTDAKAKETVVVAGADPIVEDGDRSPLFPKWIGSLNATYETSLGNGHIVFTSDLQYRGKFFNRFSPLNVNYRETPAQTLLNGAITYTVSNYEFGIFGTNLTNSRNLSLVDSVRDRPGTLVAPQEAIFYGRPRTIGARAKIKF